MRVLRRLPGFAIPEYALAGLPEPQGEVVVRLHGLGAPRDVTRNCVIVSLRPLVLAIGLPEGAAFNDLRRAAPWLSLAERAAPERVLGLVRLRAERELPLPSGRLALFETTAHANRCLPAPVLWGFYLSRWWRGRGRAYNFRMRTAELHRQYVLYTCPRPVVLVTVVHGAASNLFPMDLIGPAGDGAFLLALRSTSPAGRLMAAERRMALSSVGPALAAEVYALGRHHRLEAIDWGALPFATRPSAEFGLPVPVPALAVREVAVEAVHVVGSHTLFVTRTVRHETCAEGARLHHVSGLYHAYRARQGRPL